MFTCCEYSDSSCDTLVSFAIKKEEAAYFMYPMCFNILHVMADLQGLFTESFSRKLDTDDALLIEVFNESEKMIAKLGNSRTPLHDSFLAGSLKTVMAIFCS